jgi:hypothetical protein
MNGGSSLGGKVSASCLAVVAVLSLTACLPDSDSVREKRMQDFSESEASSFAMALSAYSVQSHWTLMRNAALLNGTLAQGEAGRSPDGALANGYCREGTGDTANHMLLAWYTQADGDGQFTVKGIGKGAGASIVQALSQHVAPQMIGYYGDNAVQLRGPRGNGETSLAIPSGCNLDIPNGAPVVVVEHIAPVDEAGIGGGSFEYRTLPCEDSGDIGVRTERRTVATRDDGTVTRGSWEAHDTTCAGAVSARAVSIERSIGNLVGALDLTATGDLQGALSGLAGLDCVKVKTGEKQTDADGNEIASGKEIADTCDTRNIDVTRYEAGGDMERTDAVLAREEMAVSCGAGNTGTQVRGQHGASFNGYTGTLYVAPWSGQAVFERFTHAAEQKDGGQNPAAGQQLDYWRGHTLQCTRIEHLLVDCFDVFPEYRGLQPVNLGGMLARRENRISGWAVKQPPAPNPPLADNVGWYDASAACAWIESGSYGCCEKLGEKWEQTSAGSKERDIVGVSIKGASAGPWRDTGAAQCREPYLYKWQDCQQDCTMVGEEQVCTETCTAKEEIRYNYGSVSLDTCTGNPPPPPPGGDGSEKPDEPGPDGDGDEGDGDGGGGGGGCVGDDCGGGCVGDSCDGDDDGGAGDGDGGGGDGGDGGGGDGGDGGGGVVPPSPPKGPGGAGIGQEGQSLCSSHATWTAYCGGSNPYPKPDPAPAGPTPGR